MEKYKFLVGQIIKNSQPPDWEAGVPKIIIICEKTSSPIIQGFWAYLI